MKTYIVGAGSVGLHVASSIHNYDNSLQIEGFLDDDPVKHGKWIKGIPVIGPSTVALDEENIAVIICITYPGLKKNIIQLLSENKAIHCPALVHSHAWVGHNVHIGKGAIIYPGTCVNYNSHIGDFCIVNMNCAIGHDTVINDFTCLSPGVSTGGRTVIGEGVEMGIGAKTIQSVHIGDSTVVGGAAMVISDVNSQSTIVGVPAKSL